MPPERDTFRIAYFVNQYPKVSHSFIRREILALERQGFEIQRLALRGWDESLVDTEDIAEKKQTHYVLQAGMWPLLASVAKQFFASPNRFLQATLLALRMSRRAERPLIYHLIYLAEACRIVPWIQAFGARHIHAHFGSNSAEVVMLAQCLGGPPYSFTVHGPEEFDKPQFLGLAEKVRRAKFVVCISSYGRSQLYRWVAHAHWSKIHIVHCGLEPNFYTQASAPLPDAPRLVCVGRLCEQKGQLLLIEAARRLARQGIEFSLVLAGDGEMRGEIEQLIQQYNLAKQIRITGWISSAQVRTEILAARAMVLPSFAEGLPVVLMEAMALRRPVLSTYVAGIPELVLPKENGWLVPAGSVDALTAALAEIAASSVGVLASMGEAAYERVVARHAIDTEASKLAQLIQASASVTS